MAYPLAKKSSHTQLITQQAHKALSYPKKPRLGVRHASTIADGYLFSRGSFLFLKIQTVIKLC